MTTILNYINNDFKALKSDEIIETVQDFFTEVSYTHFPIVEDNIYIGCIALDDLETFDSEKKISNYRYTLEGFFARSTMIWIDVMEIFAVNHTNLIPVLDEENQYIGYYEIEDIIKFFNETPFLKEKGNIIIVEKPILDYSMAQITQIVESNNGKILGTFVSDTTITTIQITIKIVAGSVNEIIQTFRRYDYDVVSQHQEDNYINNLKERSDYLDKYLNI